MSLPSWNVQEWSAVVQAVAAVLSLLTTIVLLEITRRLTRESIALTEKSVTLAEKDIVKDLEPELNLSPNLSDTSAIFVCNLGACDLADLHVVVRYWTEAVTADAIIHQDFPLSVSPADSASPKSYLAKLSPRDRWKIDLLSVHELLPAGIPDSLTGAFAKVKVNGHHPISRKYYEQVATVQIYRPEKLSTSFTIPN